MKPPLTHYSEGLKDGMETALRLALGYEAHGGDPYYGPLPPEMRHWLEAALRNVEAMKEPA